MLHWFGQVIEEREKGLLQVGVVNCSTVYGPGAVGVNLLTCWRTFGTSVLQ